MNKKSHFYEYWSLSDVIFGLLSSIGLGHGDGPDRGGDLMRQDGGYGSQPPPRQKRVRTSFKHHQLRTMKSYFALNHNPDAKDLKQLAQKTGLSKRVLQVWKKISETEI